MEDGSGHSVSLVGYEMEEHTGSHDNLRSRGVGSTKVGRKPRNK